MELVGKVDVLDNPTLVAEPDRVRPPSLLEPAARRVYAGLPIGVQAYTPNVDSAIETDQHDRGETTFFCPNGEAVLLLFQINGPRVEQHPVGIGGLDVPAPALLALDHSRGRNPAEEQRKQRRERLQHGYHPSS